MKFIRRLSFTAAFAVATLCGSAQDQAATFDRAVSTTRADLEQAMADLSSLREGILEERMPLAETLNQLEDDVVAKRRESERILRARDLRTVDLNALRTEVRQREEEVTYIGNLLTEYTRAFDSRLHIAEKQLYDDAVKASLGSVEDVNISQAERLQIQLNLVGTALDRLDNVLGGHSFEGRALVGPGILHQGRFSVLGPTAVFASAEGPYVGQAEMRANTYEPIIVDIGPEHAQAMRTIAETGSGSLPFDPTLGDALAIKMVHEPFWTWAHIKKGGPVMVPILILAFAAFTVAGFKWFEIHSIKPAKPADLQVILDALNKGDKEAAMARANAVPGAFGDLLRAGVEHSGENKELVEEILYEKMLNTQPKLERMLPFIALVAGASPLLGLLGTVTGMINTFKLITVFGTGDARSLSSGISEALITTEFGLMVAIPSLLLHAMLNRKAKGIIGDMEQISVGFINGLQTGNGSHHKKGA